MCCVTQTNSREFQHSLLFFFILFSNVRFISHFICSLYTILTERATDDSQTGDTIKSSSSIQFPENKLNFLIVLIRVGNRAQKQKCLKSIPTSTEKKREKKSCGNLSIGNCAGLKSISCRVRPFSCRLSSPPSGLNFN